MTTTALPLIVTTPAALADTFRAACIDRIPQKTRKGTPSWTGRETADDQAAFRFAIVGGRRRGVTAATQAMANVFVLIDAPAAPKTRAAPTTDAPAPAASATAPTPISQGRRGGRS